jgi:hypothetical protein
MSTFKIRYASIPPSTGIKIINFKLSTRGQGVAAMKKQFNP